MKHISEILAEAIEALPERTYPRGYIHPKSGVRRLQKLFLDNPEQPSGIGMAFALAFALASGVAAVLLVACLAAVVIVQSSRGNVVPAEVRK